MSHNIDVGNTALAPSGGSYFKKALNASKEAPGNGLTAASYYPSSLSQEYATAKKVAEIGGGPSCEYYDDGAEEDQRNDVADENDEGGQHSYSGN